MIIRTLNLNINESKIDSGNNISRLHLLIGKDGISKSHVLDVVITTLMENNGYTNKKFNHSSNRKVYL